jgi:hypothetical protein
MGRRASPCARSGDPGGWGKTVVAAKAEVSVGLGFLPSGPKGAPALGRAHPHLATLPGTGLFCAPGECVCVSDRVKVCACAGPRVRESEPRATRVNSGRIGFAAGPSRLWWRLQLQLLLCTPALASLQAGRTRRRCAPGFGSARGGAWT